MKRHDHSAVESYSALLPSPSQASMAAAAAPSHDKHGMINSGYRHVRSYVADTFPFFQWIDRYNLSWLCQDLVAGMTVGVITVPQAMAYARLANLDPQYGLYTSFIGATVYCLFGTSKDISVGPITTVSLLVGQAVSHVLAMDPTISASQVGTTLALMAGLVTLVLGLARLGILVDFIPHPAVGGYMTASALTIALSQMPALNGTGDLVDTHQAPFRVLFDFVTHLASTQPDIVFGVVSLVALYTVKTVCARYTAVDPESAGKKATRVFYYLGIMRAGLVVVLGTLLSYVVHRTTSDEPIRVIKTVPSGFDALGVPGVNATIIHETLRMLPPMVMMLIMEHVSVAKTFGRLSNYTVDPSQEIVSIGMCNLAGAFVGGYPCTGAFSRTAIMNRSGARTPLAAAFSGVMLLLALFVLTPAFYYIPDAVLAAIVIHAVSDLVSSPAYLKELWKARAMDFWVWVAAVAVALVTSVETGIYAAVGLALASLLFGLARPQVATGAGNVVSLGPADDPADAPYCPDDVLVFRPAQSILYPNAAHVSESILQTVKALTRPLVSNEHQQPELAWNEHHSLLSLQQRQPVLRAIILDMSAVQYMDATALQMLVSLRTSIETYADHPIQWHFAHTAPAVHEKLVAFGFGTPHSQHGTSTDDTSVESGSPPHDLSSNVYFHRNVQIAIREVG